MINLSDYPIFANHVSTLKETSLDTNDGQRKYMTQSSRDSINFDEVKEEYVSGLRLSSNPKSSDALFDDGSGSIIFVEFKNGYMDSKKQFDVRKKVYDSLLIFTDITSTGISNMRNTANFILVYNESVNRRNTSDPELKKKQNSEVQPSLSFDNIAKTLGKYAKEEYICFGLKIFKDYCFKEVHTFTEDEFEAYLSTL